MDGRARVIIAGGSGLIGRHLQNSLLPSEGDEWGETNRPEFHNLTRGKHGIHWDAKTLGPWTEALEGASAVVNLAGKSISVRHTEANKREILESRVRTTELIGEAIQQCKSPPKVWINANAMGYYGSCGDDLLTEDSKPGNDFFAEVSKRWQEPLDRLETPGTRKVSLRIGFVLAKDGGGLPPMAAVTKAFLGGTLGSGRQWLSWIHIDDLTDLIRWCIDGRATGPYNASAPNPVTNKEFMGTLRKALHRPWAPPAPAFALRLLGKVMAPDPSLALLSSRMIPRRALDEGFVFKFPHLMPALQDLL